MWLISYYKKILLLKYFVAMDQNTEHIKRWRKVVKQQVTMMMIVFAEWMVLSLFPANCKSLTCHKQDLNLSRFRVQVLLKELHQEATFTVLLLCSKLFLVSSDILICPSILPFKCSKYSL